MSSRTKGTFVMTPLRQRVLEELQIRHYSPNTVRAYIRSIAEFAKHFGKSPDLLGAEQIREYQLYLIKEKRVSLSSYIQAVCSLRFLYTNTLHRQVAVERIPLPRYEKKLPVILSREEVKLVLETPKNLGYRAMLSTMYAAGPQDLGSSQSQGRRHRQRPRHPLDSRRQRPQGPANLIAAKTAGVAARLLALGASQGLALPRRETRHTYLQRVHLPGLPEGWTRRRHLQGGPSALAAARLRHSPAGSRGEPPHHSASARPCPFGNHRPLSACRRHHRTLHHQPAGTAGPARYGQAASTFQPER